MTIFRNCTQHPLTPEQIRDVSDNGWVLSLGLKEVNPELFSTLSNMTGDEDLEEQALDLLDFCRGDVCLMPIGSPAFMAVFFQTVQKMRKRYAFKKTRFVFSQSIRESAESVQPDGTVKKVTVFKHIKFLEV